jgi:hypothetical protein
MPLKLEPYDPTNGLRDRALLAMRRLGQEHRLDLAKWEADQKFAAHNLEQMFTPRRKKK